MAKFTMTFGSSYNMIGTYQKDLFVPKKYQSLIEYRDASSKFKSNIKITQQDIVCGNMATPSQDGALFIENLGEIFKNNQGETYTCYDHQFSIDEIIEKYFAYIKEKELDEHIETEPVDFMTLVIPYEYTVSRKQKLKEILQHISFRVDRFIEEPVASYLGYLKTYHIPYQKQDSFMMVAIENNALKVKLFDVEWDGRDHMRFQLDGHAFDMTFGLLDVLRNYFLKQIDPHIVYNELTSSDKKELDEALDDLINELKSRKDNAVYPDFYISLPDASSFDTVYECNYGDITQEQFMKILEDSHIYKSIQMVIDSCIKQSHKLKTDIKKIIYTGEASNVYGIQEKINRDFHLNQDLMIHVDELTCLGGFVETHFTYEIEDHLKDIGIITGKKIGNGKHVYTFKAMIPAYSHTKETSLKKTIPKGMNLLRIYEGYNGAGQSDCTLLKQVNISLYADGNYSFTLERLANGGVLNLMIYDHNFQFVTAYSL